MTDTSKTPKSEHVAKLVADSVFHAKVGRLMDLCNMNASVPEMTNQMFSFLQGEFGAEFTNERARKAQEILLANSVDLTNRLCDIVAAHFDEEMVDEMIRLYSSDLGKRMLKIMPLATMDLHIAGREWAKESLPRIMQELG